MSHPRLDALLAKIDSIPRMSPEQVMQLTAEVVDGTRSGTLPDIQAKQVGTMEKVLEAYRRRSGQEAADYIRSFSGSQSKQVRYASCAKLLQTGYRNSLAAKARARS